MRIPDESAVSRRNRNAYIPYGVSSCAEYTPTGKSLEFCTEEEMMDSALA